MLLYRRQRFDAARNLTVPLDTIRQHMRSRTRLGEPTRLFSIPISWLAETNSPLPDENWLQFEAVQDFELVVRGRTHYRGTSLVKKIKPPRSTIGP